MSKVNWNEILGWSEEQFDELRISGFLFLRQGHYDKALSFFEALVAMNPKNLYDLQTLGALYLQVSDNQKALQFLDRALAIAPVHEPTLLNKVKALLGLNKVNEAIEIAKNLQLSNDPMISSDAAALIESYGR